MARAAKKSLHISREAMCELWRFADIINAYRRIVRDIFLPGTNNFERAGEHSFQLGFFAEHLNQTYGLRLRGYLLYTYSNVHDLLEIYAGDTPLFPNPKKPLHKQLTRADKKEREERALERLKRELAEVAPWVILHLTNYSAQEDEESRFIRALEKLVAAVNVWTDGGKDWKRLRLTPEVYHKRKLSLIQEIDGHPIVAELYEELIDVLEETPELFYTEGFFKQMLQRVGTAFISLSR